MDVQNRKGKTNNPKIGTAIKDLRAGMNAIEERRAGMADMNGAIEKEAVYHYGEEEAECCGAEMAAPANINGELEDLIGKLAYIRATLSMAYARLTARIVPDDGLYGDDAGGTVSLVGRARVYSNEIHEIAEAINQVVGG